MPSRFLSHWRGIVLSLIGIVATTWLAMTDQLGLYIHPRYFVFTVVMAVIAAVFVLLAFALLPSAKAEEDGHDHAEPSSRSTGWWTGVSVVLVLVSAGALLVLPPTILTTSTVAQRDINGSVSTVSQSESVSLVGGDYSSFTVKDWAGLLRQGADQEFFAGKTPTVVGFITPDTDSPDDVFYVARFVITCCAVDAQPIGVPVYLPGWQDEFDTDDWVSVTGSFIPNPSIRSVQAFVLTPTDIDVIDQPAQPYVY